MVSYLSSSRVQATDITVPCRLVCGAQGDFLQYFTPGALALIWAGQTGCAGRFEGRRASICVPLESVMQGFLNINTGSSEMQVQTLYMHLCIL